MFDIADLEGPELKGGLVAHDHHAQLLGQPTLFQGLWCPIITVACGGKLNKSQHAVLDCHYCVSASVHVCYLCRQACQSVRSTVGPHHSSALQLELVPAPARYTTSNHGCK